MCSKRLLLYFQKWPKCYTKKTESRRSNGHDVCSHRQLLSSDKFPQDFTQFSWSFGHWKLFNLLRSRITVSYSPKGNLQCIFIRPFYYRTFPVWSRILHTFAMLLMILNSSMNILFYGIFNAQFRKVARTFIKRENEGSVRPRQLRNASQTNHQKQENIEPEEIACVWTEVFDLFHWLKRIDLYKETWQNH